MQNFQRYPQKHLKNPLKRPTTWAFTIKILVDILLIYFGPGS